MFMREVKTRRRAEQAERDVKKEAVKSQQVAQFLEKMLEGVGPSVALGRDTTMLREILNKTAARIDEELTNQPDVEAALLSTLGRTYLELGEYSHALLMFTEALRLSRISFGDEHLDVAICLNDLAVAMSRLGRLVEAEAMQREALALQKR